MPRRARWRWWIAVIIQDRADEKYKERGSEEERFYNEEFENLSLDVRGLEFVPKYSKYRWQNILIIIQTDYEK